jgi:hypothetical protein
LEPLESEPAESEPLESEPTVVTDPPVSTTTPSS